MKVFEVAAGNDIGSIIEQVDLKDPSIYFILPEIPAISQLERLFLDRGLWGERLLTFGKLAAISNLKSRDRLVEISRMGRLFLVEEAVNELKDHLTYFRQIISIKGFSESLIRLIAELKHAKIYPQGLMELAKKVKGNAIKEKLNDIALMCELYQQKLSEEGLADDIDRLKLLSDNIRNGGLTTIFPEARTFIVFGFYDFTDSQLDVLKAIDDSGCRLLTYIPSFFESRKLRMEFIRKLEEYFKAIKIEHQPRSPVKKKEIEILSFRSFMEEAEFAAREIKKLIMSGSIKPEEIAVISRSYSGKESYVVRGFEKLGIPYSMPGANNLGTSPLGRFVLDLLRIKFSGLERGLFINFLRSPFLLEFFKEIDNCHELISGLDLESRERTVLGGVGQWREILNHSTNRKFAKRVGGIIDQIEKSFNSGALEELIEDLGKVLDRLLIYKAVEDLSLISASCQPSWEKLERFLKELLFLSTIRFRKRLRGVEDFISLLEDLMAEEIFSSASQVDGERIPIIGAFEAIGASFSVVFILDTGEKGFPHPAAKDPILKNSEREIIDSLLGKNSLGVDNYHYEAEELLFKLICSSAQRKLYITYSCLDQKERTKLPSYLVSDLIKNEKLAVKKISWESLSELEEIYTRDDLARYIFCRGAHEKGAIPELLRENWNPYKWVIHGIEAERLRLIPFGAYSRFEGIIHRKDLLPPLSEFSPTGFERYGDCPFKFFAAKILGLEELADVEDEASVLDVGTFYHEVLRDYFGSIAGEKGGRVDLREVTDEELLHRLNDVLNASGFDKAFERLSSGIGDLVRIRVFEETLPQFVLLEAQRIREWNDEGFFPRHFEEWLEFNIGDLRIRGKVDRVDVGAMGGLVIDYKLRSLYGRGFFGYKNLQLPLYLLGLEGKGIKPFGGYYRFVERPDEVKGNHADGRVNIPDLVEATKDLVKMYASLMREGFFAPVIEEKEPGFEKAEIELRKDDGGSCRWCEFRDLCRVQGGTIRIHGS